MQCHLSPSTILHPYPSFGPLPDIQVSVYLYLCSHLIEFLPGTSHWKVGCLSIYIYSALSHMAAYLSKAISPSILKKKPQWKMQKKIWNGVVFAKWYFLQDVWFFYLLFRILIWYWQYDRLRKRGTLSPQPLCLAKHPGEEPTVEELVPAVQLTPPCIHK